MPPLHSHIATYLWRSRNVSLITLETKRPSVFMMPRQASRYPALCWIVHSSVGHCTPGVCEISTVRSGLTLKTSPVMENDSFGRSKRTPTSTGVCAHGPFVSSHQRPVPFQSCWEQFIQIQVPGCYTWLAVKICLTVPYSSKRCQPFGDASLSLVSLMWLLPPPISFGCFPYYLTSPFLSSRTIS